MLNYKLKVGLVPLRRDVTPRPGIFNWEIAEARGREITEYIKANYTTPDTEFVDIIGVNPVNTMINEDDAEWICKHFANEGVDCVLFINANFGNEEAIAYVADKMKKPVCIWAPLDERIDADGMRYTDSQCGVFGASRLLQRLNIPFSHIETSKAGSEEFNRDFEKFLNVACMVKNFDGIRIGVVGLRPKPFTSVIFNEGELMQKFGIRSIPINIGVIVDKYNKILEERQDELAEGEASPQGIRIRSSLSGSYEGIQARCNQRRVLDGNAACSRRYALYRVQHSCGYGIHHFLRVRYARLHLHGSSQMCFQRQEGSLPR